MRILANRKSPSRQCTLHGIFQLPPSGPFFFSRLLASTSYNDRLASRSLANRAHMWYLFPEAPPAFRRKRETFPPPLSRNRLSGQRRGASSVPSVMVFRPVISCMGLLRAIAPRKRFTSLLLTGSQFFPFASLSRQIL